MSAILFRNARLIDPEKGTDRTPGRPVRPRDGSVGRERISAGQDRRFGARRRGDGAHERRGAARRVPVRVFSL